MMEQIEKSIIIEAPPSAVWNALTNPFLMKQWMAETELALEIATDWTIGNPIVMTGTHHLPFENKGTVLQFEVERVLQYNYISSLSRLPDLPENYTSIKFNLSPAEGNTSLHLTISGFATETIFRHVDFYWRGTIMKLKNLIEKQYHE